MKLILRGELTYEKICRLVFVLLSAFPFFVLSQTDSATRQKDIIDLYRNRSKNIPVVKGIDSTKHVHTAIMPGAGYSLQTRFAVGLALNIAFHKPNEKETNVSVINGLITYTQNKQLIASSQSIIWSEKNRLNFISDYRYYKYPQYTYGLGGHTSINNAELLDYSYVSLRQAALKPIGRDLYTGIGYGLDYHFNIVETRSSDQSADDFQKYGARTSSVSSGISFHFLHDNRRNSINPKGGFYSNVMYRYNSAYLGSNNDWQLMIIDLRKYIRFPAGSQNILAIWSYEWLTFGGKVPYLDLPSTGWDTYSNTGRGYIQSRFRGKDLVYLETEYRINPLKSGLVGAVIFVNAQSVPDWPDNKFRVIWPGAGLGLRIKLNKHSNTNIAIDYGFGLEGSHGFFVNLGEVF